MTALRRRLADYLETRRAAGYRLDTLERMNTSFISWLEQQGHADGFTAAQAVEWATLPAGADPNWWAMRLAAVRTFATHLAGEGVPGVDAPHKGLLPVKPSRITPYLYQPADVSALIAACRGLFAAPLPGASTAAVIGLLAATGIRIGEAVGLDASSLDAAQNTLRVYSTKTRQHRILPLHPTTTEHLQTLLAHPARPRQRADPDDPLFITTRGNRYQVATLESHFQRAVAAADLPRQPGAKPTLHSLRHSFATAAMTTAYQTGGDPARTLTLLATWLGHSSPAATYWYLAACPDLLDQAARRLAAPNPKELP
ncbi:MAG: tyrosine-type recombinase/integrase [Bifidobacteriaceae bacterium]|nr:tyrosine-type recombinase/integrase [Bifidobacteriaceae bacterium]